MRNAGAAVVGFIVPMVTVIVAIPLIVRGLGEEAFGVYSIASSTAALFSVLDLGFATGTVRLVAASAGKRDKQQQILDVVFASLLFYGGLGLLGTAALWLLASTITSAFSVSSSLSADAATAFRLAGVQVSLGLLTNVCVAFFKGLQEFRTASTLRSLIAVSTYFSAALCANQGSGLVGVALATAGAQGVMLAVSAVATARSIARQSRGIAVARFPPRATIRELIRFGSVTSVNNLAGLLANHGPRYALGVMFGPSTVAGFAIAQSVTLRVHALIGSASEALFPFVSASSDLGKIRRAYLRMLLGSGAVAVLGFFPLLVAPQQLLSWWLRDAVPVHTVFMLQALSVAGIALAFSAAPYHLANGLGRPTWNTGFILVHIVLFGATAAALLWFGLGVRAIPFALAVANATAIGGYLVYLERRFASQLAELKATNDTRAHSVSGQFPN